MTVASIRKGHNRYSRKKHINVSFESVPKPSPESHNVVIDDGINRNAMKTNTTLSNTPTTPTTPTEAPTLPLEASPTQTTTIFAPSANATPTESSPTPTNVTPTDILPTEPLTTIATPLDASAIHGTVTKASNKGEALLQGMNTGATQTDGALTATHTDNFNIASDIEMEDVALTRQKGGRPHGTTEAAKLHLQKAIVAANNEIVAKYKEVCLQSNGKVERGVLDKIIEQVRYERHLPLDFNISKRAIRMRINKDQDVIDGTRGCKSPLGEWKKKLLPSAFEWQGPGPTSLALSVLSW